MKSGYWIAAAAVSLLTIPRVQPGNQLKLPSFHGIAEVRASIPGRIRLYMPAIKSCPAARMALCIFRDTMIHVVFP